MSAKRASPKRSALNETQGQKNTPVSISEEKSIDTVDLTGANVVDTNNKENDVQSSGKKRKADEIENENSVDLDSIDCDGMKIDATCGQVRQKIRRLLDSGEVKVGEFCDAIGVSNRSLNTFLRQTKPMGGAESNTYDGAWAYFKKREIAGIKPPSKKTSKTGKSGKDNPKIDVSGIELDGEADDQVPVFDSCDEIRKKISNHLRKSDVTQASFCRDLVAQLHASKARRSIQGKQLTDFRSKKGPDAGNSSVVFYAAYVYFEKLRIKDKKPKSNHRNQMERIHPKGFSLAYTGE